MWPFLLAKFVCLGDFCCELLGSEEVVCEVCFEDFWSEMRVLDC